MAVATAQSAGAADLPARMPVKAAPAPMGAVFDWTGCYLGAHGGYAWGRERWYQAGAELAAARHNIDGWLIGGQVGCNLQRDRWVVGIEGQASWADVTGESFTVFALTGQPQGYHTKADILGTLAARLGVAFDRTLIFIKGGAAFAHERHWISIAGLTTTDTDKYLRWGGMVGAGIEHALTSNWSSKIEYNYLHLGNHSEPLCAVSTPSVCTDTQFRQHIHLVKVGINYRFGGSAGR